VFDPKAVCDGQAKPSFPQISAPHQVLPFRVTLDRAHLFDEAS
jgi:hypothetical protein